MKSFEKLQSDQYSSSICEFIQSSDGLEVTLKDQDFTVMQKIDGKTLTISLDSIKEVIIRWDAEGKKFLQLNFEESKKVLLTDRFIGFKPQKILGLDMGKLPNVVTTSDLVSILEAIEDSLLEGLSLGELEVLKNVYEAVLRGGETVGFNLKPERTWIAQISRHQNKASA